MSTLNRNSINDVYFQKLIFCDFFKKDNKINESRYKLLYIFIIVMTQFLFKLLNSCLSDFKTLPHDKMVKTLIIFLILLVYNSHKMNI